MRKVIKLFALTVLLCMGVVAAGCAKPTAENIPREELDGRNVIDAVFATYDSARVETNFYGMNGEDASQSTVYVKRNGALTVSTYFSTESGYTYGYTVEPDAVYFYYDDESYGKYVFFGDGYFEEYYLPYITDTILPTPMFIESNVLVSDSEKDNVRTLVYHADVADVEYAQELYGYQSGVLESSYIYDAKTGLLLAERYTVNEDGATTLICERALTYGQDDALAEPDYVAWTKDVSEARTLRIIMWDGREFTHVLGKDAGIVPLTMEEYEYFADPTFTVPYSGPSEDSPEETVIYIKQPDAES